MWKEIIICIVIVVIVLVSNNITQKYTVESVEELSNRLGGLKEKILVADSEESTKKELDDKLNGIWEDWEARHDKLAYYIEHNELEKVESNLTGIKSFIETKEYSQAISELDESTFVLRHIKEKYEFSLENIF